MSKYVVECWPGQAVEVEAMNEEDAFVKAIVENGWIGGEESSGNGIQFRAWVREQEED